MKLISNIPPCVLRLGLAGICLGSVSLHGASSLDYDILPVVLDGGGGVLTSVDHWMVASLEPFVIGISASADYQIGHGYIQQLGGRLTSIAGRYLFYENSAWDGRLAGQGPSDDQAIASDKAPLLNGLATFSNYSNYSLGLNGIMMDVFNLPGATLTAADFAFKVGNNSSPATWSAASAPTSVGVRRGAGVGGSDRITVTWANSVAPKKMWLRTALLATPFTGLARPSVFYFGNAIGEAGNSLGDARVTTADELLPRINPASVLNPAAINNSFDYDRDKRVTVTDQLIARENLTSVLTELRLITVTDGSLDLFSSNPSTAGTHD